MKQLVILGLLCLFSGCVVKEKVTERPAHVYHEREYVEVEPRPVIIEKHVHHHPHVKQEIVVK